MSAVIPRLVIANVNGRKVLVRREFVPKAPSAHCAIQVEDAFCTARDRLDVVGCYGACPGGYWHECNA